MIRAKTAAAFWAMVRGESGAPPAAGKGKIPAGHLRKNREDHYILGACKCGEKTYRQTMPGLFECFPCAYRSGYVSLPGP